jgi:hypothetical protein
MISCDFPFFTSNRNENRKLTKSVGFVEIMLFCEKRKLKIVNRK